MVRHLFRAMIRIITSLPVWVELTYSLQALPKLLTANELTQTCAGPNVADTAQRTCPCSMNSVILLMNNII